MSWKAAHKTKLRRIQTRQNQCVRCIFFAHKRENAKIYYAWLEILELDNIYKLGIALFAHKISIPAVTLLHQYQKFITITPGMHHIKTSSG